MSTLPLTIKFITENSKFVLARLRSGNATLLAILDQDLDIVGASHSDHPLLTTDNKSALETYSRILSRPKYGAAYKAYKCFEMGGVYFLNATLDDVADTSEIPPQCMHWEASVRNPTINI